MPASGAARSVDGLTTPQGLLARLRGRVRDRARSRPGAWWSLGVLGVASTAVGVTMLVWPGIALRAIALVIGAWLVLAGLTRLAVAVSDRSKPRDRQRLSAFVGLACLAAGLVCLGDTTTTLDLLAVVLGLQWLVGGAVDVVNGLRASRSERRWLIALGVLSCLAGAVFLIWPAVSLLAFEVALAISAIGIGVLDVTAALRLRVADRRASPAGGGAGSNAADG